MKNFKLFPFIFLVLCLLLSCTRNKRSKPNPNLPPKYVITSEPIFNHEGNLWFVGENSDTIQALKIEIADTEATREIGMMHRTTMENNCGMLFIFDEERRMSFWMRDTPLSLDIIFINENGQIVNIAESTKPYSLKKIPSFEYAKYVVEVNAGYCKTNGVKTGLNMTFSKL